MHICAGDMVASTRTLWLIHAPHPGCCRQAARPPSGRPTAFGAAVHSRNALPRNLRRARANEKRVTCSMPIQSAALTWMRGTRSASSARRSARYTKPRRSILLCYQLLCCCVIGPLLTLRLAFSQLSIILITLPGLSEFIRVNKERVVERALRMLRALLKKHHSSSSS